MELTKLQKKFYQKEVAFDNFDGLSENDINMLRVNFAKADAANYSENGLKNYIDVLRYLTSPNIHMKLPTFDDRIIALIRYTDPEMLMYKLYVATPLTTTEQVRSADHERQKDLLEQRKAEMVELIEKIRKAVGFYDSKLLKYESVLYKKYLRTTTFNKEASRNFIPNILKVAVTVRSFQNVTDERYAELSDLATLWGTQTNGIGDAKLATYAIFEQNNILGLSSTKEQLLFFILAADPELKMLTIHEEESRKDKIDERLKEEFGFSSEELIRVERLYHKKFCPDKKISVWSL